MPRKVRTPRKPGLYDVVSLGRLKPNSQQSILAPDLLLMLDPNHKLVRLAEQLPWDALEADLADCYATMGRPSIPNLAKNIYDGHTVGELTE